MSELKGTTMGGTQHAQAPSLSDEFLAELVQELDSPDIVGIMLGGSYARGAATTYSDVDLACFWREGLRPPPKRFMYRQGTLISIKMTSVAELRGLLKRPEAVLLFASGKRRLLLDKDGTVAHFLADLDAFSWEDLQAEAHANVSLWTMLMAEDVQKVLREFEQENAAGLAFVITKLITELTLLAALCHGTLITNDSTYYQQVQEAVGHDSAWTRYHCITTGLEAGPSGLIPLRAQGIAALHLYRETVAFARPLMQADHLEVAEHVLLIVSQAAEQLPLTAVEKQWLKGEI